MSWCSIRWSSNVLKKSTSMQVLLPDGGQPPFPTLYLLHGLSDDDSTWLRHTRIEMHAQRFPMIVVMPDGGRSFYTRQEQGPDYARHIGEELVDFVGRTFHAAPDQSARWIGGLSMGGYGALRVGLAYSERFGSISAHSGAYRYWDQSHGESLQRELERIFGPSPEGTDHDVRVLANRAKTAGQLPRIWMDCGRNDFLLEDSRWLHREFDRDGIVHEYVEFDNGHNWNYWDEHVRDAIAFHARSLPTVSA